MSLESIPPPEKIVSAAIQFHNEIFTGTSHAAASDSFIKKFPNWRNDSEKLVLGFMTSTGRFVLRDEAEKIGNSQSFFSAD